MGYAAAIMQPRGCATDAELQNRCGAASDEDARNEEVAKPKNLFICCDSAMLVGPRLGPARRESSGRPREGCTTMPGAGSFWVPVSNTLVVAFCRFTNDSLIPRPVGLQLLNKTLSTLPLPQRPSRRVYSS